MSDKRIIIAGCAGNHFDVLELVQHQGYTVVGFLDDRECHQGKEVRGIPVLGGLDLQIDDDNCFFVNSIAGYKSHLHRSQIFNRISSQRDKFPTIISRDTVISSSSRVGRGVVIMPHNVICAETCIGDGVYMFQGSTVNHESRIDEYSVIASGVIISGKCHIGKSAYIGTGAIVKDGISIGDNTIVGMGALILQDLEKYGVYWGSPALFQRTNGSSV